MPPRGRLALIAVAAMLVGGCLALLPSVPTATALAVRHVEGTLPDGARYVMDVPDSWNGIVLLYSHGIVPAGLGLANPPQDSYGNGDKQILLTKHYALIGSSYASEGWAIAQAIPDQLQTLTLFIKRFGQPRHTIAWGQSMGGMITTAIAEEDPQVIDGSLATCGLVTGGVAEFNALLDSAFAIKTLLAPDSDAALVNLGDLSSAGASYTKLAKVVEAAQATAVGRARIALAAALYDVPFYSNEGQVDPPPGNWQAAEVNQEAAVIGEVFSAQFIFRDEAEQRAGGNMSWNTGVDYGALLARSADAAEVQALYAQAGLSLAQDLRTLNNAPRINADPAALTYMERYVSFTGDLAKPQFDIHTTGDGLLPVEAESAYRTATEAAGRSYLLRQAYVDEPGHCTFTAGEVTAAVEVIVHRVLTGHWGDTSPVALNELAEQNEPGIPARYVSFQPDQYPRPFSLPARETPWRETAKRG